MLVPLMAVPKKRTSPIPKKASTPIAKKSASKKPANVAVIVPVNRALKLAWEKQKKIIVDASREDMSAWDRKYEAVAEVVSHDPPLYLAGGFADFTAFASEFLHEDVRLVRDWVAVALRASPAEELLYTPTRLSLLLSLLRAQSKEGSLPKTVAWAKLRVPVVKEGSKKSESKSALDASLDEIRAARRQAMQAKSPVVTRDGKEVAAMRVVLASKPLKPVKVQYRDGMYPFGAVPAYALEDFARALLKLDSSESEAKNKTESKRPRRK